ncbi:MAG: phage/plasmid primase, P4 family [Neglectibacter timonensis]
MNDYAAMKQKLLNLTWPSATMPISHIRIATRLFPDIEGYLRMICDTRDREIPDVSIQPVIPEAGPAGSLAKEARNALLKTILPPVPQLDQAKQELAKDSFASTITALVSDLLNTFPFRVAGEAIYTYKAPRWEKVSSKDVEVMIRERYMQEPAIGNNLTPGRCETLVKAIRCAPQIQIEADAFDRLTGIINFSDSTFDCTSLRFGLQKAANYFTTYVNVSRSEIEAASHEGVFDCYLEHAAGGDKAIRQLMLEVIGVCISNYLPKNFFVLQGPTDTGKSLFGKIICSILGRDVCCHLPSIEALSGNFTSGMLPGKKLCFCLDCPDSGITSESAAALKMYTGDSEIVTGNQKYVQPFSFRLTAKFLFATNHTIHLKQGGKDDAFFNRAITIPFLHSIPREEQDIHLLDHLMQERGYIVHCALKALAHLKENNFSFSHVPVASGKDYADPYEFIRSFVLECCVLQESAKVLTRELYAAYQVYCGQHGVTPMVANRFIPAVKQIFPQVRSTKIKSSVRGLCGIFLKDQ